MCRCFVARGCERNLGERDARKQATKFCRRIGGTAFHFCALLTDEYLVSPNLFQDIWSVVEGGHFLIGQSPLEA